VSRYRDRIVWQKARELVSAVYRETAAWPSDERYGLTSQVRRAAVSVPANIAEGYGRVGSRELKHHCSIAHGSLCELETLLYLAVDLDLSAPDDVRPLFDLSTEVGKLLTSTILRLE
jgi:four helix bundle protein